MVFLTTKMMQRTALFVTFGGLVTSLITTFLPLWKTMNSDLNEVENWFSGLWHTCLYTEEVGVQCKAYESIMGLPMDLQISRVLMSVSIATGGLALLATFPGLEGVEMCVGQPGLKRRLLILGGVLSWVSGLTTLAPVSLVAYTTVVDFWDEGFPDVMPRWEYGEAMFSGWFGGLALVIGGTLFFVAVCMGDYDQRPPSVPNSPQAKHRTKHYPSLIAFQGMLRLSISLSAPESGQESERESADLFTKARPQRESNSHDRSAQFAAGGGLCEELSAKTQTHTHTL